MIHRVKPTKRQRIEDSHFAISLTELDRNGVASFKAEFNFDNLDVDPDSSFVVEAYRVRRSMRFTWGTISQLQPPSDRRLTEIPGNPLFRLKVLSPDGTGRILASRDRIKPNTPEGAPSLLWLEETSGLGNEVWKIDFDHEVPTILVNSDIDGISADVRQNGRFRALVLPHVVRTILRRALIDDGHAADDHEGQWAEWITFIRNFHNSDFPGYTGDESYDRDEKAKWIETAVRNFTASHFNATQSYLAEGRRQ